MSPPPRLSLRSCLCTVLLEKIDGSRVQFHNVAVAEPRRDLLDHLIWSMLSPHPSSRSHCNSAVTEPAYLEEGRLGPVEKWAWLTMPHGYVRSAPAVSDSQTGSYERMKAHVLSVVKSKNSNKLLKSRSTVCL
ncbi:hypothetical protein Y032_0277g1124 [Ancylostoma ceylanicum]|uniref:Uncharacterized protein n=1 Tax=Ancylostoma ceylanicum TaxID=53326 RepID=A0A016S8A6_9BILA|nr:hypothetical protein Y032_0277g1124 [Ancylostoma ceylanicum]